VHGVNVTAKYTRSTFPVNNAESGPAGLSSEIAQSVDSDIGTASIAGIKELEGAAGAGIVGGTMEGGEIEGKTGFVAFSTGGPETVEIESRATTALEAIVVCCSSSNSIRSWHIRVLFDGWRGCLSFV